MADEGMPPTEETGVALPTEMPPNAPSDKGTELQIKAKEFSLSRTAFYTTTFLAVLGFVSTVVLAFTGYWSADHRADEDFRRGQQRTAYSEFYAAATQIHTTHGRIVDLGTEAVDEKLDSDYDEIKKLDATLTENDTALSEKYAALVLVASDATKEAADKVYYGLLSIYLNERFKALDEIEFGKVGTDVALNAYVQKLGEIPKMLSDFLEAGKKDIGVYG